MKERFDKFMSELVETNAPLSFFSDFKKIAANVDAIAVKLNQLNYLVGQEDMERAIRNLWNENPKVFSALDILIAVRATDRKKTIDKYGKTRLIEEFFQTPEGVIEYIEGTGLKRYSRINKYITWWIMSLALKQVSIPMPAKIEADILWNSG